MPQVMNAGSSRARCVRRDCFINQFSQGRAHRAVRQCASSLTSEQGGARTLETEAFSRFKVSAELNLSRRVNRNQARLFEFGEPNREHPCMQVDIRTLKL